MLRKLCEMNMKIIQSVHGKQKIKLINSILMNNTTAIIICQCKKPLFINSLIKNSTKNLYYIQQIIEQLSLSYCKALIKFC